MKTVVILSMVIGLAVFTTSCKKHQTATVPTPDSAMMKLNDFASFKLTTNLSVLSENEKKMIPLLIDVANIMDDIFWIRSLW